MTKNGSEESNQNWIKWEAIEDECIVQKTPLTTNCTFIGLGIEKLSEYNILKASGEEHIMFTNRENIPNMKTVMGTQNFYQLQGDINPVLDGKLNIQVSPLQCSCSLCRNDPSNLETCMYKNERKISTSVVKNIEHVIADEKNDRHGLSSHLVVGFEDELKSRSLTATGRKAVIHARLDEYMDGERPRSAAVIAFLES